MRFPIFRSSTRAFVPALIFLAAMIFAAPAAWAQNITASASVTETNVEPGQPVEYDIQINGAEANRPPPAPEVDGLTITYIGQNQTHDTTFAGNRLRVTSSMTYMYSVETERPGRYTIPGQEITVGGNTVRVSPVAINVTGSAGGNAGAGGRNNADQARFVRLIISKKTAYVGENIPVEVRCYFGVRLNFDPDTNPILSGEGFSAQKFTRPELMTEDVEDAKFNVVTYKTSIAAAKTGTLTVGPVELQPKIQMPRPQTRGQRRFSSPFDDPFFRDPFGAFGGGSITKMVKLQSDPAKIEIKPLPPGAPEEFSGAIGQFKLEAEAQGYPRKSQAGDPVTLHAMLHGQGNFDRVQAPVLADDSGLQTYPATAKFKADDDTNSRGTKTFEQVVIPHNGRDALPGYKFVYLDPTAGKYVTLETPPIPVKIVGSAPTPTPAPNVAAGGAPAPGASAAKPTPTPQAQDILYIRNDPGTLLPSEAFLPLYRRQIFWLAQLVPLALLLGFAGASWRRARAHDEARRRAAELHRLQTELVRTLHGEKTARRDFYSAATRLAQLKTTGARGTAGDSLTADEVSRAKGLDASTAASLEEIFHRHDELAYSGGRAAQETVPVHERKDVLETVGKL